jgi:hypothetical protein
LQAKRNISAGTQELLADLAGLNQHAWGCMRALRFISVPVNAASHTTMEKAPVIHLVIAFAVFACVFGSAMVGLQLRHHLPEHHLSDESISAVKLATGLVATLAALVLGLLISSAKVAFDTESGDLVHNAASVISLDRALANYGPETQEIRVLLKRTYADSVDIIASGNSAQLSRLGSPEALRRTEDFQQKIEALSPHSASQSRLQARALGIVDTIFSARWLALLHAHASVPSSLLIILVFWLSVIFGTFGLFARRNATVVAALAVCALSTACAIFLIEELSTPLDGIARVSVAPMREALSRLGE